MESCNVEVLRKLYEGFPLLTTTCAANGTSPVIAAVANSRVDVLYLLQELGVNIFEADGRGSTSWTAAVLSTSSVGVFDFLREASLESDSLSTSDQNGWIASSLAAEHCNVLVLRWLFRNYIYEELINLADNEGRSIQSIAEARKNPVLLALLEEFRPQEDDGEVEA